MRKAILLIAGVFITLTATAQAKPEVTIGNGKTTRDVREVAEFNKLKIAGPFEVRLISGDAGSVIIEGEKNLIGLINTEVNNQTLTIAPQKGKLFKSSKDNKIIIKVPFKILEEISFTGSGKVNGKKTIKNNIKIYMDGSGNINLNLDSSMSEAILVGSGNITLSGRTQTIKCEVTGSGLIRAQDLESSVADVTVTGSGNAEVFSKQSIKGTITGSGNIAYSGEPKEKDLKRTGTGEFRVY